MAPHPQQAFTIPPKGVAFHETLLSRLLGISLASFSSGKLRFSQLIVDAKTMQALVKSPSYNYQPHTVQSVSAVTALGK